MTVRFVKPTSDDLLAYAREIGFRGFDAGRFLDHYEMVGWVTGRNRAPMRDWKAAVRLWRRNARDWAAERGAGGGLEDDPTVLDYARQARRIITEERGMNIGLFYDKVRDAIGPDGLARVRRVAEGQK
jgi:hypothetical protein